MKKENFHTVHYLLSSTEIDKILGDIRDLSTNEDVFQFLLKNEIILELDKTNRNADGIMLDFIQNRLFRLDIHLNLDDKKLYKKVRKKVNAQKIEIDQIPNYLAKQLNKNIPKNYIICCIDRNDDKTYLVLLKKKHFKKLMVQPVSIGVFSKFKTITAEPDAAN